MEMQLFSHAAEILTRLLSAVVIVLVGAIMARILGKVLTAFLSEIEFNNAIYEYTHVSLNFEDNIGSIVSYICYIVTFSLAFDALGITRLAIIVILGIMTFFFTLSLVVGVRDFFPNLYAGLILMNGKKVTEGDKIKYEGTKVTITKIGFVETHMQTKEGDILFVPNAEMVKKRK